MKMKIKMLLIALVGLLTSCGGEFTGAYTKKIPASLGGGTITIPIVIESDK